MLPVDEVGTFEGSASSSNRLPMTIKPINLLVALALSIGLGAAAQNPIQTECINADDPVLSMLDSLTMAKYFARSKFTTDTVKLNHNKWKPGEIPTFSDEVISKRLAALDKKTPFKFTLNDPVKAYIRAYSVTHRDKVSRFLGLAQLYFPLFEEVLDKHDLPLEFKYLAVVESALNPVARSKSGATGLWQFMYRTGKIYDLEATSYVDERCDPYLATEAACEYFKFLYSIFNDWNLVLAAYNGGPGTLTKAIRRSGGERDYWKLRPHLPQETGGYVPAFIAVNYVMHHASDHNIYPIEPEFFNYELDTVKVRKQLSLTTLANVLQMDVAQLLFLNPMFRKGIVPASENGMTVILPKHKLGVYLANEESIYELEQAPPPVELVAEAAPVKEDRKVHVVKKGETLSSIAARYRCTVNELRDWNGISGNGIGVGQRIAVYTDGPALQATSTPSGERFHTIQKGDTLFGIAKDHNISVADLKKKSGLTERSTLRVGQRIRIG